MRKLQKKEMKNNVVEDEKHIARECNKKQSNELLMRSNYYGSINYFQSSIIISLDCRVGAKAPIICFL